MKFRLRAGANSDPDDAPAQGGLETEKVLFTAQRGFFRFRAGTIHQEDNAASSALLTKPSLLASIPSNIDFEPDECSPEVRIPSPSLSTTLIFSAADNS
jgi:hypothetical protein